MNNNAKKIIQNLIEKGFNNAMDSGKIDSYDKEALSSMYPRLITKGSADLGSDISVATFALSGALRKDPNSLSEVLHTEIKEIIETSSDDSLDLIAKIKLTGPYINFWFSRLATERNVLKALENNDIKSDENASKTVLIDYSSPNIAKQFHIGHLKTTIVGNMLYRLHKKLGYNTVGINHLGDYGTQFGKLIEGYKLWKDEYNLDENPIEDLNDIYVRINDLSKKDEEVLARCRENFKKLEAGDEECVAIWQKFKDLSMDEFNKIYEELDVSFDSFKGESFYSDKMDDVVKLLEEKDLLKDSEGAKVVDLEDEGLGTVLIQKENGSSIYITRDIAAILYRAKTYDYFKNIYVVASEQTLHFKQLFKIVEMLGVDSKYVEGAKHVPYGMINLPSGKMSTRLGNVITIEELISEGISRVKDKMSKKDSLTEEEIDKVSKEVAIGAIKFSNLSNRLIKDQTFVWDNVLDFNGDTGPYIQYVNVRINSILREYSEKFKEDENIWNEGIIDVFESLMKDNDSKAILESDEAYNVFMKVSEFEGALKESADKYEPYILTNYLIEVSKAFNRYYNSNKVLTDNTNLRLIGILICKITSKVIKESMDVLGISLPDKM